MTGPSMAIGDNTIFTLEPSASLVSTIGIASLIVLFDIAGLNMEGFKSLEEGAAVVLVSHRQSTMRITDKIYSVENGRMS